jgi:hypothetical protein
MNMKLLHRTVFLLFTSLLLANTPALQAQSGALAVQDSAALEAQLDYIHENTRIYNDYRAIREDVFQKLRQNIRDSLSLIRRGALQLNSKISEQDSQIESLQTDLRRANNERDDAVKNRDSLSILGIQMKKGIYNTIMWLITLGLAVMSVLMFSLFKRAHMVTKEVKSELESIQDEFEEYRKSSREKYEKLVVSHHSEIMKLKNS